MREGGTSNRQGSLRLGQKKRGGERSLEGNIDIGTWVSFKEYSRNLLAGSQTEHSGDPLGDPSARVFEVFLIALDGVQGETLWGGKSRARDHTHKREQKAGQAAAERTTGQQ